MIWSATAAPTAVTSWKMREETRKGSLSSTQATCVFINSSSFQYSFLYSNLYVCFCASFVFLFVLSNHSKKNASEACDEDANDEKRSRPNSVDIWGCYWGHLKGRIGKTLSSLCGPKFAPQIVGPPPPKMSKQWFYQHCDKEASAHDDSRLQGTRVNWFWLVSKKTNSALESKFHSIARASWRIMFDDRRIWCLCW